MSIDRYNIAKVYEEHLKSSLIEAVTKNIVDSMVADFKKDAEKLVRAEAEKISLAGAEIFNTHEDFRQQFAIYLRWTDEKGI